MALLCDQCVASSDARFALPETGLGMIPGVGGTQTLPRLLGLGRALRLVLTGDWLDARAARDSVSSRESSPRRGCSPPRWRCARVARSTATRTAAALRRRRPRTPLVRAALEPGRVRLRAWPRAWRRRLAVRGLLRAAVLRAEPSNRRRREPREHIELRQHSRPDVSRPGDPGLRGSAADLRSAVGDGAAARQRAAPARRRAGRSRRRCCRPTPTTTSPRTTPRRRSAPSSCR